MADPSVVDTVWRETPTWAWLLFVLGAEARLALRRIRQGIAQHDRRLIALEQRAGLPSPPPLPDAETPAALRIIGGAEK